MTYTTLPIDPILDLTTGVGQRQFTATFKLVNGVSGMNLGTLTPLRNATLTHDTANVTKRTLSLNLGVADSRAINPITDRIDVTVTINRVNYPLGRYMFTASTEEESLAGDMARCQLQDIMFSIDQETDVGISGRGKPVGSVISTVLASFDLDVVIENSDFTSAQTWPAGTRRGQILNDLALTGGYFSPWFDNLNRLRFVSAFNPADQVPQFDLDEGNQVIRDGVTRTSDLLSAPNRFMVVSNSSSSSDQPVYGLADVPITAPHSVQNRGFVIQQTVDAQVSTIPQATKMAQSLAYSQQILQYTNLSTIPDPRHDSYDVVQWQRELWLETAWSMSLSAGGTMTHTFTRAYT
jgi:hypothetical protein